MDDSPEKTSLDDRALGSQSVGFDTIVKSGPMHQKEATDDGSGGWVCGA